MTHRRTGSATATGAGAGSAAVGGPQARTLLAVAALLLAVAGTVGAASAPLSSGVRTVISPLTVAPVDSWNTTGAMDATPDYRFPLMLP